MKLEPTFSQTIRIGSYIFCLKNIAESSNMQLSLAVRTVEHFSSRTISFCSRIFVSRFRGVQQHATFSCCSREAPDIFTKRGSAAV